MFSIRVREEPADLLGCSTEAPLGLRRQRRQWKQYLTQTLVTGKQIGMLNVLPFKLTKAALALSHSSEE